MSSWGDWFDPIWDLFRLSRRILRLLLVLVAIAVALGIGSRLQGLPWSIAITNVYAGLVMAFLVLLGLKAYTNHKAALKPRTDLPLGPALISSPNRDEWEGLLANKDKHHEQVLHAKEENWEKERGAIVRDRDLWKSKHDTSQEQITVLAAQLRSAKDKEAEYDVRLHNAATDKRLHENEAKESKTNLATLAKEITGLNGEIAKRDELFKVVQDNFHKLRWLNAFGMERPAVMPLGDPYAVAMMRGCVEELRPALKSAAEGARHVLVALLEQMEREGDETPKFYLARFVHQRVLSQFVGILGALDEVLFLKQEPRPALIVVVARYHCVRAWIARSVQLQNGNLRTVPGSAEWRVADGRFFSELAQKLARSELADVQQEIRRIEREHNYPVELPD